MERSIGVERTYVLGQFKNVKFSDYISGVPEHLLLNAEVMSNLRLLQIIQVDKAYLTYLHTSLTLSDFDPSNPKAVEELLEQVDAARTSTLESLKEAIASVNVPENKQTVTEDK